MGAKLVGEVDNDGAVADLPPRQAHISRRGWRRIAIVSLLICISALSYACGSIFLGVSPISTQAAGLLLMGLAAGLLGAVAIFLSLERGVTFHPALEREWLPFPEFLKRIEEASNKQRIRVLDTYTYLGTDRYWKQFEKAVKKSHSDEIEILLVHPYSPGAITRATQIPGEEMRNGLRLNLARFYHMQQQEQQDKRNRLHVFLYKALPTLAMYGRGDEAYISFFPPGKVADRSPQLDVYSSDLFGQFANNTFRELKSFAEPHPVTVKLRDHMQIKVNGWNGREEKPCHFAFGEVDLTDVESWSYCYVAGEDLANHIQVGEVNNLEFDGIKFEAIPVWPPLSQQNMRGEPNDPAALKEACERLHERYENKHYLSTTETIVRFNRVKTAG